MSKIAVIGGTGFASLKNLEITHSTTVKTPFGVPSAPLSYGILGNQEVVYLPRRGSSQPMAPHKINYRANIWALRDAGVQTILATAAVGKISHLFNIGEIIIPDQLIDYTYGRENTFLGEETIVDEMSFAYPYSAALRERIISQAKQRDLNIHTSATYGIVQGPRLETLAEVTKLERDGCHLVGRTGMPEATLARELGLDYACLAFVVRQAANCIDKSNAQEVEAGEKRVKALIEEIITAFSD